MLSFKDFKNTDTTFEKLYADAFEYGFSSNDTESDFCFQSHKIAKVLDKKSNIQQCNLTIDVNRVLYGRKHSLNKLEVDYIEDEVVRKKQLQAPIHVISTIMCLTQWMKTKLWRFR